jgi:hypothetical protein
MLSLIDNVKKAKIKSGFKTVFYKYQERELKIKAARICKEQQDVPEIQPDNDDDELSDAELYQTGLLDLDTETELTRYLKLLAMLRETNIYQY